MRSSCVAFALVLAVIGGCDFSPPTLPVSGEAFDVLHVPAQGEQPGQGDLILQDGARIDTYKLQVNGVPPADGISFDVQAHDPADGSELAVLHVGDLTIVENATVVVYGTRPLVIIAAGAAVIDGVVDASAKKSEPGPGGYSIGKGPGAGAKGSTDDPADSGGGGGGSTGPGGIGGDGRFRGALATGGPGGGDYMSKLAITLMGGSGGGASSPLCANSRPAGAGGGAVQITALGSIEIGPSGGINVGGGGGGGGSDCVTLTSGAGAGSGGMIVLQSPSVLHDGLLAANGGGGGGSGGLQDFNEPRAGLDGEDGQLALIAAGGGQRGGNTVSNDGGDGGFAGAPPQNGLDVLDGNGGGGGGSVGYILIVSDNGALDGTGASSPAASVQALP